MDITTSVIQTVMAVCPTAQKCVQYQRNHKDYVAKFETMQRNLKCLLQDVQTKVDTQLRAQHGKKEMDEVKNWREEAHQATLLKVEELICKGGCFTHICSSTNLENKTRELETRLQVGGEFKRQDACLVKDDHSIKGDPLYVEEISGRDDIQEQILQWLKGDKVKLAVCGMGGVGKTTIMKHVHNKLLKESKFDKVFWVTVPKDFGLLNFQKTIAHSLELKLELQDEDETKLARLILRKLRQGSNLLILDDVWHSFPLEDVGIPNLDGNNGCTIVLTTQVQEVASKMNCDIIPVKPLPDKEALKLFLNTVHKTQSSGGTHKRDVEPISKKILEKILEKCGGLPLAIVTVATDMNGKFDPPSGKLALSKLSKFEKIVDRLKLSIEYLAPPQVQNCFLSCALYPKNYEISEEELIEYWIEEGFIYKEEETRDMMNCEGHEIFEKLVNKRLLKLVKVDDGDCYVTMHDLFRDIVLDSNPRFWVKDGKTLEMLLEHGLKEKLLKVSIMNNYIREIPSSMLSLQRSNLTTFLLSNNEISKIPEVFFDDMPALKILNLSNNPRLITLPSSVSKLEKLTTLLLSGCWSLREVPSLSNLGDLKKLDLSGTSIEKLPQGLCMLTNLKYLGLGGRLSEIPDGLLQNFCKLQHLEVDWNIPLKGEEIERLRMLEFFYGRFSSVHDMSIIFNSGSISLNMCALIVGSRQVLSAMKPYDAQRLYISRCKDVRSSNNISGFQDATDLLCIGTKGCNDVEAEFVPSLPWLNAIGNLEVPDLSHLDNLNPGFGEEGAVPKSASLPAGTFSSFKEINDWGWKKKKKLFPYRRLEYQESVFVSGFNPLPTLQYLHLWQLENVESVFDENDLALSPALPLTATTHFSLKTMRIHRCPHLKKVFSSATLLHCFQFLETIEVEDCEQMEELISSSAYVEVTLPKLQRLRLTGLPALKSFFSSSSVLICDSIKSLKIVGCENIKRIPLSFPLLDNAQSSRHSLKEIVVSPKEWWESLKWDHPNAKGVLLPFCKFRVDYDEIEEEEEEEP